MPSTMSSTSKWMCSPLDYSCLLPQGLWKRLSEDFEISPVTGWSGKLTPGNQKIIFWFWFYTYFILKTLLRYTKILRGKTYWNCRNTLNCSITISLNAWLSDCLLAWLAGWLSEWITDWMFDYLTVSLTDYLNDWLTVQLSACLIGWLTECLTDWLAQWLTDVWLNVSDWMSDEFSDWLTSENLSDLLMGWPLVWVITEGMSYKWSWARWWGLESLFHHLTYQFIVYPFVPKEKPISPVKGKYH